MEGVNLSSFWKDGLKEGERSRRTEYQSCTLLIILCLQSSL